MLLFLAVSVVEYLLIVDNAHSRVPDSRMWTNRFQAVFLIGTLVIFLFIRSSLGSKADDSLKRKLREDTEWKDFNWDQKWSEYENCEVEKVCPDYNENCADGVAWTSLTATLKGIGKTDIEIIDLSGPLPRFQSLPFQNGRNVDLDKYKRDYCHLVIVTKDTKDKKGNECKVWQTQDRCPWISKSDYEAFFEHSLGSMSFTINTTEYNCEPMPLECNPDTEEYPTSCYYGPGWKGGLKTKTENGQLFIDWTALVQEQSCVEWVTLIDKKTNKSKSIYGTTSDVNIPIRYMNKTCDMKIFVFGFKGEGTSCYAVEAKVPCEEDKSSECAIESDSSTSNAIAISLSVTAVVFIIIFSSIVIVVQKRKRTIDQENSGRQEQSELNDTYGTYYQVCSIKRLVRITHLKY